MLSLIAKAAQKARIIASLCLLSVMAYMALGQYAQAVPSFARQTGQPCAACHTAFPELTPFGRQFKLNGYTLQGGDSNLPHVSAMVQSTVTHYLQSLHAPDGNYAPPSPNGGFGSNDNINLAQQASLFYAGRITDNFGAFIQTTYSNGYTKSFSLDLADVRYANSTKIFGNDIVFGVTANNAPTVQDLWNTTPQWNFPYIKSVFALSPAASTLIEGFGSSQTLGAGAYVFAHDMLYAELSAYGSLTPSTQNVLGVTSPDTGNTIKGLAPYWRLALEPNWGNNSLMIGTFGMFANIAPDRDYQNGTNKITDLGFDAQYQWIGDMHAITARASYIRENQQLDSSYLTQASSNSSNDLNSFKGSLSYIYDHSYSLTAGYFSTTGSADAKIYAGNGGDPLVVNPNGSPNSAGYIFDIAYLPFSHGAPGPWPWLNTRIGLSYTVFTKYDGLKTNIDGYGRNASDNNTLMLYAFTAF
jgi:hypothetical protein